MHSSYETSRAMRAHRSVRIYKFHSPGKFHLKFSLECHRPQITTPALKSGQHQKRRGRPTEAASERYGTASGVPISSPSNCRPSNNRGPRAHANCTCHSGPISRSPHERPRGNLVDIRRCSECASKRGLHRQYLPKRSPLRKPRCPRLLPRWQGICIVLSSSILRLCF